MTHDIRHEAVRLLYGLQGQLLCMADDAAQAFIARLAAYAMMPVALGFDPEARGPRVTENGDAVIEVAGDLVPAASPWAEAVLGVASVARIMDEFRAAQGDASVRSITFRVSSPGGLATDIPDAADEILAARGPNKKRMRAVVHGVMASAAYWLLAGVNTISASRTSIVGSIGASLPPHFDLTDALARNGVKVTTFVTGAFKDLGSPFKPLTEEGRALLQDRVDRVGAIFFAHVAKARGLTVDDVRAMQARIFDGDGALDAKLIDKVAPTRAALRADEQVRAAADASAQEDDEVKTKEQEGKGGDGSIDLEAHRAEVERARSEGSATAKAEVETAWKTRVQGIRDAFAGPLKGRPELAGKLGALMASCIADGDTVEQAQAKCIALLAEGDGGEVSNRHTGTGDSQRPSARIDYRKIYADFDAAVAEAKANRPVPIEIG